MQLETNLVVAKPFAGQARPVEGVFALLDILFGLAALVVELCDILWFISHVGHDKAHARKQFVGMPFYLCDHAARLAPALRLIVEILIEAFDL